MDYEIFLSDDEDLHDPEVKYKDAYTASKILYKQGRLEDCLKVLKHAFRLKPSETLQTKINKVEDHLECEAKDIPEVFIEGKLHVGYGLCVNENLYNKLYDYQKEGVRWLFQIYKSKQGGILADDMGLGKTIQMIFIIRELFEAQQISKVLIILPKSLLAIWEREFKRWAPAVRVLDFHAGDRAKNLKLILERSGVLLTTTVTVMNTWRFINSFQVKWDFLVVDEGHKIKNPSSKSFKAVNALRAKIRIIMTGTAVQNNLRELWTLLDFTHQGRLLGRYQVFKDQYERPITDARNKDASEEVKAYGDMISKSFKAIIEPFFLRRTKEEVTKSDSGGMPKLSQKNDLVIWIKMSATQLECYQRFLKMDDIKLILTGRDKRSPLLEINVLKKICDHVRLLPAESCKSLGVKFSSTITDVNIGDLLNESGKMAFLQDLLENLVREGHKTLVFSQSKVILNIVERILRLKTFRFLRLDGDVNSTEDRQRIVDGFNNNETYKVLLLTTQVGGVGLTLSGADRVVIYDPSWNPATDSQAIDRIYRIGQNKNVVIYRLITCGTVEEKIYRRQVFKESLNRQTTAVTKADDNVFRYFTQSELRELFKMGDIERSETQAQLEKMHSGYRTYPHLEQHLKWLSERDISGISHHDLMFSQEDLQFNIDDETTQRNIVKFKSAELKLLEDAAVSGKVDEEVSGDMNEDGLNGQGAENGLPFKRDKKEMHLGPKNDFIVWVNLSELQTQHYRKCIELYLNDESYENNNENYHRKTDILTKLSNHLRLLSPDVCSVLGVEFYETIKCADDTDLLGESGKIGFLLDLLKRLVEDNHKTIVFVNDQTLLDVLQALLITREISFINLCECDTKFALAEFNTGQMYNVIITTRLRGAKLNLIATDRIVFFDPIWDLASDNAIVKRFHRITTGRNLIVYRLLTCSTIEEQIYRQYVYRDFARHNSEIDRENLEGLFRDLSQYEIDKLFTLDDPTVSFTQLQLERTNAPDRLTYPDLEKHIQWLSELDMFGISDHDLIVKKIKRTNKRVRSLKCDKYLRKFAQDNEPDDENDKNGEEIKSIKRMKDEDLVDIVSKIRKNNSVNSSTGNNRYCLRLGRTNDDLRKIKVDVWDDDSIRKINFFSFRKPPELFMPTRSDSSVTYKRTRDYDISADSDLGLSKAAGTIEDNSEYDDNWNDEKKSKILETDSSNLLEDSYFFPIEKINYEDVDDSEMSKKSVKIETQKNNQVDKRKFNENDDIVKKINFGVARRNKLFDDLDFDNFERRRFDESKVKLELRHDFEFTPESPGLIKETVTNNNQNNKKNRNVNDQKNVGSVSNSYASRAFSHENGNSLHEVRDYSQNVNSKRKQELKPLEATTTQKIQWKSSRKNNVKMMSSDDYEDGAFHGMDLSSSQKVNGSKKLELDTFRTGKRYFSTYDLDEMDDCIDYEIKKKRMQEDDDDYDSSSQDSSNSFVATDYM